MEREFVEIVIKSDEAQARGIDSRDEIEDPVSEALDNSGLGEVTGGGGGSGVYVLDVELDGDRFEEALAVVRKALIEVGAPDTTVIKKRGPQPRVYSLRGP